MLYCALLQLPCCMVWYVRHSLIVAFKNHTEYMCCSSQRTAIQNHQVRIVEEMNREKACRYYVPLAELRILTNGAAVENTTECRSI